MRTRNLLAACVLAMAAGAAQSQSPVTAGADCTAAPKMLCPDGDCALEGSGRDFLLDFPCDLQAGEKLAFILLLHGAGSSPAWVRSYFPAVDYKEKHRLVIAIPRAASENRIWNAAKDDAALQEIAEQVFARFGRANISRFWLAGHSQGGITATRLICNDYFSRHVDGLLSLSGSRIGPTGLAPDFFAPPPGGTPPGATPPPARASGQGAAAPPLPTCDFSYVYATGEHEIPGLPEVSPWAQKYGCGKRQSRASVQDTRAGYVTGSNQPRNASYGRLARPGVSRVMVYPDCQEGRLVADIMRMDKGHTEGLEPAISEEILRLISHGPGR